MTSFSAFWKKVMVQMKHYWSRQIYVVHRNNVSHSSSWHALHWLDNSSRSSMRIHACFTNVNDCSVDVQYDEIHVTQCMSILHGSRDHDGRNSLITGEARSNDEPNLPMCRQSDAKLSSNLSAFFFPTIFSSNLVVISCVCYFVFRKLRMDSTFFVNHTPQSPCGTPA